MCSLSLSISEKSAGSAARIDDTEADVVLSGVQVLERRAAAGAEGRGPGWDDVEQVCSMQRACGR
jgi:hypothetical protein